MAKKDPNINLKGLRKNVLKNLVDRNKEIEPNTEYWSMQLLIGLGLIHDPDAGKDDEVEGGMTKSEREEKLKEVGLFIPVGSLDDMNDELDKLAADNIAKMKMENMNRLSKEEVTTLRKLGMSNE